MSMHDNWETEIPKVSWAMRKILRIRDLVVEE
jgi:hypothetical protein